MPWDRNTTQASAIFAQTIADALAPSADFAGNGDWDDAAAGAFLVALYNDDVATAAAPTDVPNRMALAPTYDADDWSTGNITDTGAAPNNWPLTGRPLTAVTFDGFAGPQSFPPYMNLAGTRFDADDTAGADIVTLDEVWGSLLYKPAGVYPGQGCAYHSFGGPNSVAAGLFTVLWHDAGIMIVTVSGQYVPNPFRG